jgi:hypothetical protein
MNLGLYSGGVWIRGPRLHSGIEASSSHRLDWTMTSAIHIIGWPTYTPRYSSIVSILIFSEGALVALVAPVGNDPASPGLLGLQAMHAWRPHMCDSGVGIGICMLDLRLHLWYFIYIKLYPGRLNGKVYNVRCKVHSGWGWVKSGFQIY